jgi:integrase
MCCRIGHLRDSKTGPRDVPLGVPVRQFLKTYRKSLPRLAKVPGAPVFPSPANLTTPYVRSGIGRKAANLPDTLRIHDLRHSFVSHAIMAGETLFFYVTVAGA